MNLKRILVALLVFGASGCQHGSGIQQDLSMCDPVDFSPLQEQQINPVSLLENGEYLFERGRPVGPACAQARICQIDSYTRERFSQSFYLLLSSAGGEEVGRLFPNLVAQVREGSESTGWHLYLNNFCEVFE